MTCDETGAGCRPSVSQTFDFNGRVEMREGPDRAGNLADGNDVARTKQTVEITLQLGIPERQLQSESHRLRMHAVRAADHRRPPVFLGTDPNRVHRAGDAADDQVAGLPHLHRLRGVDDVGGRQAEMQPSRRGANLLSDRGREGDDIVVRDRFDRFDPLDVERGFLAQLFRGFSRDDAGFRHRVGGGEFDLEPCLVASLLAPDGPHFGVRVTLNHSSCGLRPYCNARRSAVRSGDPDPTTVAASCWPLKSSFATR